MHFNVYAVCTLSSAPKGGSSKGGSRIFDCFNFPRPPPGSACVWPGCLGIYRAGPLVDDSVLQSDRECQQQKNKNNRYIRNLSIATMHILNTYVYMYMFVCMHERHRNAKMFHIQMLYCIWVFCSFTTSKTIQVIRVSPLFQNIMLLILPLITLAR